MCRNIRTLYNFEPPATDDEIHAAALQFVRKISGFNSPSQVNEAALYQAVEKVSASSRQLLDALVTQAPSKDRKAEAAKAKARAAKRFGAAMLAMLLGAQVIGACNASPDGAEAPTSGLDINPTTDPAIVSATTESSNAPSAAVPTGPSDSGTTNVELEVDTSAVGTCGSRIILGVKNTVREVRPENPFIIQAVDLRINADIAVASIAAFACGGDYLYALVNVGDPNDPSGWLPAIASIRLQTSGGFGNWKLTGLPKTSSLTSAGDIEAAGGRLWVTTSDPGYFRVFDLQAPDTPREIGSLELPASYAASGWSPMLAIGDGYAFVTTGTGVLVIDLFEPDAPALLANVDAPGDPMGELAEKALAYATDVVAEGRSALASGPDGVWSVVRDEATGDWQVGGVISFGAGVRRFIGRHDGHPGIERTMPSDTGEEWASVYEEIDLRLPEAPVVAAAAGLPNGYARRLVLISDTLFAVRHDGSVERVASEKLSVYDPHVK